MHEQNEIPDLREKKNVIIEGQEQKFDVRNVYFKQLNDRKSSIHCDAVHPSEEEEKKNSLFTLLLSRVPWVELARASFSFGVIWLVPASRVSQQWRHDRLVCSF